MLDSLSSWEIVLFIQGLLCMWMFFLFLWGKKLDNMGIVDVGWSGGMAWAALLVVLILPSEQILRTWLAGGLLILWALRLSSFILFKRVLGKEEDSRYARLKDHWGAAASPKFLFIVFMPQAFLVTLFLLPLWVVMQNPDPVFRIWDVLAVGIWLVAVLGEYWADLQLTAWREDPDNRGKTCRRGLWKYSRHPNYFFEWVHWFAYVLFSVGSPYGYLSLLGPVLMFLFLFRITGIPHTEKQALISRGEDYKQYQKTTSVFFPWPPKELKS